MLNEVILDFGFIDFSSYIGYFCLNLCLIDLVFLVILRLSFVEFLFLLMKFLL